MNPLTINRLKHFAELLDPIPDEKWCTGEYELMAGQKCAAGWLGTRDGAHVSDETAELNELLRPVTNLEKPLAGNCDDVVVTLNDAVASHDKLHKFGITAKDRLLNAIEQRLKMETNHDRDFEKRSEA